MSVTLFPVHPQAEEFLYSLLKLRLEEPDTNISHTALPTFDEHRRFVSGNPYLAWFLVRSGGENVGAVYLTRAREIGIYIIPAHRGKGIARDAVQQLMDAYPGEFLANIAPGNGPSAKFFEKLGFTLVQHTYARR